MERNKQRHYPAKSICHFLDRDMEALVLYFGVHRDADVQLQSLPLSKLHLRALFLMFILEGDDYGK